MNAPFDLPPLPDCIINDTQEARDRRREAVQILLRRARRAAIKYLGKDEAMCLWDTLGNRKRGAKKGKARDPERDQKLLTSTGGTATEKRHRATLRAKKREEIAKLQRAGFPMLETSLLSREEGKNSSGG